MTLVYQARVGVSWARPAGLDLVRVDDGTTLTVSTAPSPWRLAHFPHEAYRTSFRWTFRAEGREHQVVIGIGKGSPWRLRQVHRVLFLIGPDGLLAQLEYVPLQGPAQLQGYGQNWDVKTLARAGLFNRGTELRCDAVLVLSTRYPRWWRSREMELQLHEPTRMPLPLLAFYALAQSAWGF